MQYTVNNFNKFMENSNILLDHILKIRYNWYLKVHNWIHLNLGLIKNWKCGLNVIQAKGKITQWFDRYFIFNIFCKLIYLQYIYVYFYKILKLLVFIFILLMVFYMIGLGLGNPEDISIKGLKAIRSCK